MSIVNRQNNLFAAEDWKVAYKAYSEVDFQAYDFDTISTNNPIDIKWLLLILCILIFGFPIFDH